MALLLIQVDRVAEVGLEWPPIASIVGYSLVYAMVLTWVLRGDPELLRGATR